MPDDQDMNRHYLPLGRLLYELDRREPPALVVQPGDQVVVETEDAWSGQVRKAGDRRDKATMPRSNPVSGPVAVAGAEPGDALTVEIIEIEPLIGQCATYLWPHDYMLASLGHEAEHQTRICAIRDGRIHWSEETVIPYAPLIGVLATAPDLGTPTTVPVGDYGGNLDLKELGPGTTVWLPVYLPGGLLFIGDCHAAQGDCELSAVALEMPARVTLRLGLAKSANIPAPRFSSETEMGAVGIASTLENAIARAFGLLALWLEESYDWNRWEAYSFVTQVGRLSVGYFRFGVAAAKIDRELARSRGRSARSDA